VRSTTKANGKDQLLEVNAQEDDHIHDPDQNLELNNQKRNEQRNVVSEQQQQDAENKGFYNCNKIEMK
jgi:hypothetical protein